MQLAFESVAVKLDSTHSYLRGSCSPWPWRWAGFRPVSSSLEFPFGGLCGSDSIFLAFLCVLGRLTLPAVLKTLLLQSSFIHGGNTFFSQLLSGVGKVGAWQTESLVWRCWLKLVESLQTCDILRACISLTTPEPHFVFSPACKGLMPTPFNDGQFFQRILESDPSLGLSYTHQNLEWFRGFD